MADLLRTLYRPRLAERQVVLFCHDPEMAQLVVQQGADREIAITWIQHDHWEREPHAFYVIFVPNREATLWEDLLQREFYGAGNYILNWF